MKGQLITPDMMEASYRQLLSCLPFRRWRLPHPDSVEFNVTRHKDRSAHHRAYKDGSGHEIAVSAHKVKTFNLLNECMAHEMVHMRQDQLGMRDEHGVGFKRLAKLVCRRCGFDVSAF
jgi:hypothetical protein